MQSLRCASSRSRIFRAIPTSIQARSPVRGMSSWAQAQGIDGRSLHCWKLNLGRAQPSSVLELVAISPPAVSTRARYTVRVDGIEVEVGDDFCEETLQRLLEVVVAC